MPGEINIPTSQYLSFVSEQMLPWRREAVIITRRQQQPNAILHGISGMEADTDRETNLPQQLVGISCSYTEDLYRLPTEVIPMFVHCLPEGNRV
jgi:hypothetical protein